MRVSGRQSSEAAGASHTVNAVVYQDGGAWIAQALEFNVMAQARSASEAVKRLELAFASEVSIARDLGREPLSGLGPAPRRFWEMFEQATFTIPREKERFSVELNGSSSTESSVHLVARRSGSIAA
jgi:hypothetical protein